MGAGVIHDPQEIRHLAGVIGGHVDAPPASRIVLAILEMSRDYYVTHEKLIDAYLDATDHEMAGRMDRRNISQHFKHLRHGLRGAGVPITINADYGMGYRMTRPDGYVPPWRKEGDDG